MATARSIWTRIRRLVERMFRRSENAHTQAVVETLKRVAVFQGLPSSVLYELAESVYVRTYRRDEFLYYEHDPGLGMYIVEQGSIRLVCENDGALVELRHVTAYESFGLRAMLGDFRRLESAQAVTDSRVLGFFNPNLRMMLNRSPKAGALVTAALARHMAEQQMSLMEVLAEREGKEEARRLLGQASETLPVTTLE